MRSGEVWRTSSYRKIYVKHGRDKSMLVCPSFCLSLVRELCLVQNRKVLRIYINRICICHRKHYTYSRRMSRNGINIYLSIVRNTVHRESSIGFAILSLHWAGVLGAMVVNVWSTGISRENRPHNDWNYMYDLRMHNCLLALAVCGCVTLFSFGSNTQFRHQVGINLTEKPMIVL